MSEAGVEAAAAHVLRVSGAVDKYLRDAVEVLRRNNAKRTDLIEILVRADKDKASTATSSLNKGAAVGSATAFTVAVPLVGPGFATLAGCMGAIVGATAVQWWTCAPKEDGSDTLHIISKETTAATEAIVRHLADVRSAWASAVNAAGTRDWDSAYRAFRQLAAIARSK